MKLTADSLATHLSRQFLPAYLVSGDEALLAGEAAAAIRAQARQAGYTERQVFFAERGFDWDGLRTESRSLSLFAQRRILEVKLPTGKPGEGAALLEELVTQPIPDQLLLVLSGKLDRTALQSGWVKAFERHGGWVQVWPVDAARLPAWITERMRRQGLQPDQEAARFLAERVEGNLLAAQQEIDKLALLVEPGPVDAATLAQVIVNSARYDVFQLGDATLRGDAGRALRILDGLRSEGAEPTLVLWAVCRELRALWRELSGGEEGKGGWQRPNSALPEAVKRAHKLSIPALVQEAVRVDRAIKGRLAGDPWDALALLVARFAGVPGLPRVAVPGAL